MDGTWLEITLPCAREELDAVCAKLTMNGVTGLQIEDEEEFRAFLEQNRQYWDYVDEELTARMAGVCQVKLYVTDDADGQAALRRYLSGLEEREYISRPLLDNDWATSWQKYYRPLPVGEKLYIVPQWLRGESVPPGRRALYLNPGLTFGTGNHASTQLCLEGLEKAVEPGVRVLDLGCGSGILSIAALRLGAGSAVAVDIDDKCRDAAGENAGLNGVDPGTFTVLTGNILTDGALAERIGGGYDLVLANIVADVIIALAPRVRGLLSPGGTFLCSGIIEGRVEEVEAALAANGLTLLERREDGGWFALTCE